MSAAIVPFPAMPERKPRGDLEAAFYEACGSADPLAIPIHLAERRLADTPDRDERLKWARTQLNDGLRQRRHAGGNPRMLQQTEGNLAAAFLIIGHALGVTHPEDALRRGLWGGGAS